MARKEASGVEKRPNSIRVRVPLSDGTVIRETVTVDGSPLPPTPANLKYAARLVTDIRRLDLLGALNLAEFFPHHAKPTQAASLTLGALLDDWLKSKGTLSKASKSQYTSAVRFWKALLGEDTPVESLTYKKLAARIGGHPWPSAKTHNNYLIALRGAFDLEYRGENALKNPAAGLKNIKVLKRLPDPLTPDERDKVMQDMRKHYPPQVVAYFLWQFHTGMRPEETIALRWSDLDMGRKVVRVQRVRTFRGSERDGTKTNQVRDVDLTPGALEALQIMRPITSMLRRDDESGEAPDIFQHPVTKRPWHDERSQRDTYWRPTLKRCGIRWRSAYSTRHTFATIALMAGIVPAYIAGQLGHSVQMLLERYARWIPGADNGAAKAALAAALSPQISPEFPQSREAA